MSFPQDLFANSTTPIIGVRIKLDRPIDRERPCHSNVCVIGPGKEPHAGELVCADCGRHRGWLSKATANWIESAIGRFGAPTSPIVVRRGHSMPAANTERETTQRMQEMHMFKGNKVELNKALEFMRRGSRLVELHSKNNTEWWIVPGGYVSTDVAERIKRHPRAVGQQDALFPGLHQTWRMASFVSALDGGGVEAVTHTNERN